MVDGRGASPKALTEAPTRWEGDAAPILSAGRLRDAKQVAALWGVTARTVYSWVDQGLMPCQRLGARLIRFSERDLAEFLRRSGSEHQ